MCRFDVVLATPAPSLSPPHAPRRRLDHLATSEYEKCRLWTVKIESGVIRRGESKCFHFNIAPSGREMLLPFLMLQSSSARWLSLSKRCPEFVEGPAKSCRSSETDQPPKAPSLAVPKLPLRPGTLRLAQGARLGISSEVLNDVLAEFVEGPAKSCRISETDQPPKAPSLAVPKLPLRPGTLRLAQGARLPASLTPLGLIAGRRQSCQ